MAKVNGTTNGNGKMVTFNQGGYWRQETPSRHNMVCGYHKPEDSQHNKTVSVVTKLGYPELDKKIWVTQKGTVMSHETNKKISSEEYFALPSEILNWTYTFQGIQIENLYAKHLEFNHYSMSYRRVLVDHKLTIMDTREAMKMAFEDPERFARMGLDTGVNTTWHFDINIKEVVEPLEDDNDGQEHYVFDDVQNEDLMILDVTGGCITWLHPEEDTWHWAPWGEFEDDDDFINSIPKGEKVVVTRAFIDWYME